MSIEVLALVFEVLPEFGLAHARVDDGRILGINKQTRGVVFDDLQVGQWLRCCVAERFSRVLQWRLVEPGDDPRRVGAPIERPKSRCPGRRWPMAFVGPLQTSDHGNGSFASGARNRHG